MMTSKLNVMTGAMEWEIVDEYYDYRQELARAGFADMLHDYERNRLYYAGLKKVIGQMKAQNKYVHVLDIGTGTGILAMMAARCGADRVTACEAFKPMINVTKKCLKANGMADKVKLIEKRSTEIKVGVDMDERANVLVTEVFDTEMIGEGAISTYSHALKHLLTEDCRVIPDNGSIFVQIVDSPICRNWNWINKVEPDSIGIKVPEDYQNIGGNVIFDVQMTEFNDFKAITEPQVAFKFSFSGKTPLVYEEQNLIELTSKVNGSTHAVFMWWTANMDEEGEIVLSCAPKWAHHSPANMQWRDHWMQAIYFPSTYLNVKENEKFYIKCNHDEYSLWFDLFTQEQLGNDIVKCQDFKQPLQMSLVSRNRLLQLNNSNRNQLFIDILKRYESEYKNIFIISDDISLVPLFAAKLKYKHVFVTETNRHRKLCLEAFISLNGLQDRITVINKGAHEVNNTDLKNQKIDIVFSECSFGNTMLPWDNLYILNCLKNLSQFKSDDDFVILPTEIKFKAIAVNLENLNKIRSPVVDCEGFDLTEFDKVILDACEECDGFIEPHPLWEYPSFPMSEAHEICSIKLSDAFKEDKLKFNKAFNLVNEGTLNGIAIWHEIIYDREDETLSSGLVDKLVKNEHVKWTYEYKQAVQLLDKPLSIDEANVKQYSVECNINYMVSEGNFDIKFVVNS